jgi:hypothetical protein
MSDVSVLAPVPAPLPPPPDGRPPVGVRVFGAPGHPVTAALAPEAPGAPATVTVALLGATFTEADNALLLDAVADAWWHRRRLVLIHLGAGGAALLRSSMAGRRLPGWLAVELPPVPSPAAVRLAARLVPADLTGEVLAGGAGAHTVTWRPITLPQPWEGPGAAGSVLVTGGLGGLGVRVAGYLSYRYGLHPVLLDRAAPAPGSPADRHLRRLGGCAPGVSVRIADVTDERAVARALDGLAAPAAMVHCAGVLGPAGDCGAAALAAVQAVKVGGLRHVLTAVDTRRLRHLITFGSALAEEPPHNLGCYALANELLRRETLRAARDLPAATTVVAEWSIWAGAGMAHELGVVAQARRAGMTPIALRPGMRALSRILALPPGTRHARALICQGGPP